MQSVTAYPFEPFGWNVVPRAQIVTVCFLIGLIKRREKIDYCSRTVEAYRLVASHSVLDFGDCTTGMLHQCITCRAPAGKNTLFTPAS